MRVFQIAVVLLAFARPACAEQPPAYELIATPVRRVEAVLTVEFTSPKLDAVHWIMMAAHPPELPSQIDVVSSLEPFGVPIRELSASRQMIFRALIPAETEKLKTSCSVRLKTEATLMARRLVPRAAGAKPPSVAPICEADRAKWLVVTELMDHDAKEFQQWLDDNKLRRAGDEPDVDFARRVFLIICKTFTYKHPFDHDGRASIVCKVRFGDCGCLTSVFVSALRANGIPARELVGRRAFSTKVSEPGNGHAAAEFFAEGIGWVPADPTAGLDDKSADAKESFGVDRGELFVMHLDGNLQCDSIYFGLSPLVRLQGIHFAAVANGGFEEFKNVEMWTVRTISFPADRRRWVYAVYSQSELLAAEGGSVRESLNRLGERGWELVNVTPGDQITYHFKRPK